MIAYTRRKTSMIDEKILFDYVKDYLFEHEVFNSTYDYIDTVENLPEDVQRLIFAKIGAMMIDFAKSVDF